MDQFAQDERKRNDASASQTSPWVSEASYWHPEHRVASAWHEHAPFAYWLIAAVKPVTVVELGTHNGFSFFVFCEAAKRLGLSTQCFALDTWVGDEHAGYYSAEVFDAVTSIAQADYADSAHLVRGYFRDSVASFGDGSIDVLHIDGRHRYEDAREDFETYLPKLSSRGVVLFHDTMETENGFGVLQFWRELEEKFPRSSFQFHHGHGLGVLGVGDDLPRGLVDLFSSAAEDGARIRATYSRLGARVAEDFENGTLRAANEQLSRRLDDRSQLVAPTEEAMRSTTARFDELSLRQHDLLTSTSWRVTRPLRWVKARFKRQAG